MLETIMINSAYVALIAGSQRKDMVSLRILMMTAASAFIVYGLLRGIWPMVAWNLIIGGNHLRLLAGQYRRASAEAEVGPGPESIPEPVRLEAVPLESLTAPQPLPHPQPVPHTVSLHGSRSGVLTAAHPGPPATPLRAVPTVPAEPVAVGAIPAEYRQMIVSGAAGRPTGGSGRPMGREVPTPAVA